MIFARRKSEWDQLWFDFEISFLGLNRGFGSTPKGLMMDLENIQKVEESIWFNEGKILAALKV